MAAENKPASSGPEDPTRPLDVSVELLLDGDDEGLPLIVAQGERWATAKALAGWLGYSSYRRVLALADRYAADVADLRSVLTVRTDAGPRAVAVFSERAWYRLAFVAQTARGEQLRALFGDWLHGEAKLRRKVTGKADALALAQDIVRDARRRLRPIAEGLPRRCDERAAIESLREDLREQRATLGVAAAEGGARGLAGQFSPGQRAEGGASALMRGIGGRP